jgi:hypothetical protein
MIVALEYGKQSYHAERQQPIHPPLVPMYQQWRQDEVMNKEDEQIDGKMAPYHQHFCPVEFNVLIADGAYIQTHDGCCEEYSPQHSVSRIFVLRLILHPIHKTQFLCFYCVAVLLAKSVHNWCKGTQKKPARENFSANRLVYSVNQKDFTVLSPS